MIHPRYRGIIPPIITPLCGRDALDVAGLERLVNRLIDGGVAGIFALGTTGEAPSLSYPLRREVVKYTCQFASGRVPVLVGITDTSIVEAIQLAGESADFGAAAVVTSAPFYFPAGQPELREYLEELLPEIPIPVMLYNMPALTKVSFQREVIQWALDQERIVGLKDSSGDLVYFRKMLALAGPRRPDWSLLVGPEELLGESVLFGGHGGVNGGANLQPRLYVDLYEAAASGDLKRTRELSDVVLQLGESLYHIGKHSSSLIKSLKCSLSILGICDDFMAAPFFRFQKAERDLVASQLERLGIRA